MQKLHCVCKVTEECTLMSVQDKMLAVTFLQTTDTFTSVPATGPHNIHFSNTSHILYMSFISGRRGDGGGVTGKKTSKPMTAVQDCV